MQINRNVGHRFPKNHSNAVPRHIIAFDTETLPHPSDHSGRRFSHTWRLGVAITGELIGDRIINRHTIRLRTTDEFWQLVYAATGNNHTTWLISHNALFDLVVAGFATEFMESRLVTDWPRSKRAKGGSTTDSNDRGGLCVIDSPPTILACKCVATQGRLVAMDTLNWFQAPLSDLGVACGLPKMQMPDFQASDDDWFHYCERDTEIVWRTFTELVRWVKAQDMGMFRYTGPSQAMAAYRHKYMTHPIYVHTDQAAKAIERASYFGGRSEVFRKGELKETVHQLDVSALFPSIMRDGKFPYVLHATEIREEYGSIPTGLRWGECVAECDITTPLALFPVKRNDVIIYPTGTFKATLCGDELQFAYQAGLINAMRSIAVYRTADLFSAWVNDLWQLRTYYKASGNLLYAEFTKRLMNSLYGKFGQLSPEWVNVVNGMAGEPWTSWTESNAGTDEVTHFRSLGWQIQKRCERLEIDGTFVAIPAFITAAARMRMNRLRGIAGINNVYYQGVDSLIVSDSGLADLANAGEIAANDLGKLRLQASAHTGVIYGCGDYVIGDKIVIAGKAKLSKKMEGGDNLQRKFSATNHMFRGAAIADVREELSEWVRRGNYRKGTVGDDGWVKPLELMEC